MFLYREDVTHSIRIKEQLNDSIITVHRICKPFESIKKLTHKINNIHTQTQHTKILYKLNA